MTNVERVSIESDEHGFELHLELDEDVCTHSMAHGTLILNVQSVAEELYDAVKGSIGPWLAERDEALAEYRSGVASDPLLQGKLDEILNREYDGTGLCMTLEQADNERKARRERGE
jgi:hypothetical protein